MRLKASPVTDCARLAGCIEDVYRRLREARPRTASAGSLDSSH
jgi:hypothetical protein